MIQEVINALSRGISKAFEGYTIYTESVEQGLKTPCFFIYCNNYTDELYRGNRYKVSTDIVIEYVPDNTQKINNAVNNVIEKLYEVTELIEDESNFLRGLNRSIENTEGGVIFNVRYEYFYYKTDKVDNMEDLKERTDVNG